MELVGAEFRRITQALPVDPPQRDPSKILLPRFGVIVVNASFAPVDEVLIGRSLTRRRNRPVDDLGNATVDVRPDDRLPIIVRPVLIETEAFKPNDPMELDPLPQDGKVDFSDLVTVARNYGKTGSELGWVDGDFLDEGRVGFDDLLMVAKNYGSAAPTASQLAQFDPAFQADVERAFADVPDPSALPVLSLAMLMLGRVRGA